MTRRELWEALLAEARNEYTQTADAAWYRLRGGAHRIVVEVAQDGRWEARESYPDGMYRLDPVGGGCGFESFAAFLRREGLRPDRARFPFRYDDRPAPWPWR